MGRLHFLESLDSFFSIKVLVDGDDSVKDEDGEDDARFNPGGDRMFFVLIIFKLSDHERDDS